MLNPGPVSRCIERHGITKKLETRIHMLHMDGSSYAKQGCNWILQGSLPISLGADGCCLEDVTVLPCQLEFDD